MTDVLDVTLQQARITDQRVGGPDEYMIAEIFGLAMVEGSPAPLSFTVKQTVGASYSASVFEVGGTVTVAGFTLDHATLTREVAPFLQGQVGAGGLGIRAAGNIPVTIQNVHLAVQPHSFKCPAEREMPSAAW